MNVRNFDKSMQEQISAICCGGGLNGEKPELLLHCCCAPCSSACLERLKDYFNITVLFYNPNIESDEYERRKLELIRFVSATGWADFLDCDHDESEFYRAVKGLENCAEGGARCERCFEQRLRRTAEIAENGGYAFFTTTLTISPMKDAALINGLGESLQGRAKWLYCDFKKRNGFLRSTQLTKEYDLYRQNYCGCVFSRKAAEKG